jgi:curved DNA-binding protein CbpA
VSQKTHYDHLELPPSASADEIKKSFRALIARYHPDKVQHLGKEFQDMAADRAAELTEAYRILSDAGRRADYDRMLGAAPQAAAPPPAPSQAAQPEPVQQPAAEASKAAAGHAPPQQPQAPSPEASGSFKQERQVRDEYLRKATLSRFRTAIDAVGGGYDETQLRGFEMAFIPKSKFLSRNKNPRLLGRFLARVDGSAVAETWVDAGKWSDEEVCVFLLGSSLAPARELATAISEQRKRSKSKVTLIPVDARDWAAHMPTDAPDVAKSLLAKLRSGT